MEESRQPELVPAEVEEHLPTTGLAPATELAFYRSCAWTALPALALSGLLAPLGVKAIAFTTFFLAPLANPLGLEILDWAMWLALPLLLSVPLGIWAARRTRTLATHSREQAQAAASGAGLTAAITACMTLTLAATGGGIDVFVKGLPLVLLGIASVGMQAFAPLRELPEGKREDSLPILYPALAVTGGTFLFALAVAGAAERLLPNLPGVGALLTWAWKLLPGHAGWALRNFLLLTLLTPVTFVYAKAIRRRFPQVPWVAVGAGVVAPTLLFLPFVLYLFGLPHLDPFDSTLVPVLGAVLGSFPHLLTVFLAYLTGPTRPRRALDGESPRLPGPTAAGLTRAPGGEARDGEERHRLPPIPGLLGLDADVDHAR